MSEAQQGAGTPARRQRKVRVGVVTSDKMTRTVTVALERRFAHATYGKRVTRSSRFKARNDLGAREGDLVRIMETRPLAKTVRWRVCEILQRAK
jgi:small subunit ribosomal protein S17